MRLLLMRTEGGGRLGGVRPVTTKKHHAVKFREQTDRAALLHFWSLGLFLSSAGCLRGSKASSANQTTY